MKNILNISLFFVIIGCTFISSVDEIIIETPTTQCGMCKKTIESNLMTIKGVKSANVDISNYQTIIKYKPDKVDLKDLELAISKSGYQANNIKADSMVYKKLPYCCLLPHDRKMKKLY